MDLLAFALGLGVLILAGLLAVALPAIVGLEATADLILKARGALLAALLGLTPVGGVLG